MENPGFIHLRVHSAYSLSQGAIPVKKLVGLAADLGQPAVAVTDTNNLFGALEFSGAAAGKGVQPIIGCTLSVRMPEPDEEATGRQNPATPTGELASVGLLVKDEEGYLNLLNLLKISYLDDKEQIDAAASFDDLLAYNAGLVLLTGGVKGPVGHALLAGDRSGAETMMSQMAAAYDGRCYVELQRHGMAEETSTEDAFLDMAYAMDIPLVATNDVHFPTADMYEAHDALLCIAEKAYLSEADRKRLTPHHWLKPASDMRALFADLPEAVDNTLVIAKRCAFMVEKIAPILPPFDCGEGRNEEDELRAQSIEGLKARLETQVFQAGMSEAERADAAKAYEERLDYELSVINQMGFPGYFLIVADFISWAKAQGIPVGPGRGSGAGSVVAWALTITDLDPLRFGLLFERFLNPERVSMPDFDVDFCQDRRDEVIRYVQDKYGYAQVAQIITFGKLQARAVLRDVGRVLEMPFGYIDKICKLVPNNPANPVTLQEAIDGEVQLRDMMADDPAVQNLVEMALKLEGLYRHASTHAAGVVIGDRPLERLIPLYRDPGSDMPVTGFNMKFVESAGLVKFDFLGLKTLTVLSTAVALCQDKGVEIDLSTIPLDDAKTFEMIGRGETTGVFQLESQGMRDVLRQMKADTFEDIIAIVALYRPGPMDNIPSYIARKHGTEKPDYLHPVLEPILTETFGIMIYQEQVMQAAQLLSGYTLGGADLLRRAMGKKIKEEMDKQRQTFVEGAVENKVDKDTASHIFDQVAKFAGYGFNKSHAAAYALVAYQTAYMKANHPVEFLAASMTLDQHNTDKLNVFKQELDRMGIDLLPPDINRSLVTFSVEPADAPASAEEEGQGGYAKIRYALAAVKNVGAAAMAGLVAERKANGLFKDLSDFAARMDPRAINKRQMENLVRAGAFDGFTANRRQMHEVLDKVLKEASSLQAEKASGQVSLFGGEAAVAAPAIQFSNLPDWTPMDRLREEFDAVGFYLSAHPLDAYQGALKRRRVATTAQVHEDCMAGSRRMAGTVVEKKERRSAKGSRYAFVKFSDPTGTFEGIMFSESLSQHREALEVGNSFLIDVSVEIEADSPRFVIQGLTPLDEAASENLMGIDVFIGEPEPLAPLHDILDRLETGAVAVRVVSRTLKGAEVEIELGARYAISADVIMAVKSVNGVLDVAER